ncbi:MAG: class I SAM-dependent methyltransferase [Planctomycetota bacterium]
MSEQTDLAPTYRHVAWAYDAIASAYSLGAIDRAKAWHHRLIQPGSRVLYIGAGRGKEIADACLRGADVTCVEPCSTMASRLHDRLSAAGDGFTIVPKPVQSIPPRPDYDLVVAHFFLNVFDAQRMPDVLAHLCRFVKPGGSIIIADFRPAQQNAGPVDRLMRWLYYHPVNIVGWLLRICALHPVYDYAPRLNMSGLEIQTRESFRVLPVLPALYETVVAQYKKEPPTCDGG